MCTGWADRRLRSRKKTELGYINAGITGLGGLSLTDLDGDGYAEIIVSGSNLKVLNGMKSIAGRGRRGRSGNHRRANGQRSCARDCDLQRQHSGLSNTHGAME